MTDQESLKEYIETCLKGDLRGRSVESHALEMLRTFYANYKTAQARADLAIVTGNIEYYVKWLEDQLPKAVTLTEKAIELGNYIE